MCKSMVDIQSATAEIRRAKKKTEERNRTKNIMACPKLHIAAIIIQYTNSGTVHPYRTVRLDRLAPRTVANSNVGIAHLCLSHWASLTIIINLSYVSINYSYVTVQQNTSTTFGGGGHCFDRRVFVCRFVCRISKKLQVDFHGIWKKNIDMDKRRVG